MVKKLIILLLFIVCGSTPSWSGTSKQSIYLSIRHSNNSKIEIKNSYKDMFLSGVISALTEAGWFVYIDPDLVKEALDYSVRRKRSEDKYFNAVLKQLTLRPKGFSDEPQSMVAFHWKPIHLNRSCEIAKPMDKGTIPQLALDFKWQDATLYMVNTFKGMNIGPGTPIQSANPTVNALLTSGANILLKDKYTVTSAAVDARVETESKGDYRADRGWAEVHVFCDHLIDIMRNNNVSSSVKQP